MNESVSKIQRFDDNPSSVGISQYVVSHVDESAMSARAVISTPRPDRVRHVVNPLGGDYTEYKSNPVVFWEHGLKGGPLSLPIATSSDPDNRLCVYPTREEIEAVGYFSGRNQQSEQIFALIADRIIRATSIRFRPAVAPVMKAGVTYYDDWIMEEWSWAAFGVNPDAVAGVVAKGRLAGSQIDEVIMKSLLSQLPKRQAYRIGLDFESLCKSCCEACKSGSGSCESHEEEGAMKKSLPPKPADDEEDVDVEEESSSSEAGKDGPKAEAKPGWKTGGGETPDSESEDEEPVYEQPPEDDEEEAPPEEEAPSQPKSVGYGAKMLRATHKALSTIHGNMNGAMGELEHPGVKERLSNVHRQIGEMAEGVAGYFASTYPNIPLEDQEDQEQQAVVKSLLARKPIRRLGLVDVITDLAALNEDLDEPVLKSAVGRLTTLLDQARREQESVLKSEGATPVQPKKVAPPAATNDAPPAAVIDRLRETKDSWSRAASLLKSLKAATGQR